MNKILDNPWQVALIVAGIYLGTALAMEWWDRQQAALPPTKPETTLPKRPCGCGGGSSEL